MHPQNTSLHPAVYREYTGDVYTDEQIVNMFLATCDRSPYTLRNYRNAIAQFMQFIGYHPLGKVTWRQIEVFKIGLIKGFGSKTGKSHAPATVANLIAPLRSLYKWGSDPNIGIFSHNPTTCIKTPKVTVTSTKHYLTKREVSRLIDQLKKQGERDYVIGVALVLLGLRVSELISIKWDDFHSDPSDTSVWLTVMEGKGGKQREVKVPKSLWDLFQNMPNYPKAGQSRNTRIFPITTRQVERIFQTARELCDLGKKVTPHWLRHTNATLALLNGASLQQVQETLGHAQINTTQRYMHTVDQIKKAAPDFVEDCLKDIM